MGAPESIPPAPLGAGKPRALITNAAAPIGMCRVVGWVDEGGKTRSWIEDDFSDRKDAVARVDALLAAGASCATAFNDRDRNVYTVNPAYRQFQQPTSVTKLAGLIVRAPLPARPALRGLLPDIPNA